MNCNERSEAAFSSTSPERDPVAAFGRAGKDAGGAIIGIGRGKWLGNLKDLGIVDQPLGWMVLAEPLQKVLSPSKQSIIATYIAAKHQECHTPDPEIVAARFPISYGAPYDYKTFLRTVLFPSHFSFIDDSVPFLER